MQVMLYNCYTQQKWYKQIIRVNQISCFDEQDLNRKECLKIILVIVEKYL